MPKALATIEEISAQSAESARSRRPLDGGRTNRTAGISLAISQADATDEHSSIRLRRAAPPVSRRASVGSTEHGEDASVVGARGVHLAVHVEGTDRIMLHLCVLGTAGHILGQPW